jgi:hypothetical protein
MDTSLGLTRLQRPITTQELLYRNNELNSTKRGLLKFLSHHLIEEGPGIIVESPLPCPQ